MSINVVSITAITGEIVFTDETGRYKEYLRIADNNWMMRVGSSWTPINPIFTEILETRYQRFKTTPT